LEGASTAGDCPPDDEEPGAAADVTPQRETPGLKATEFAPVDPWDGREPYDWESKWPKDAQRKQWVEAVYLIGVLLVCALLLFAVATHKLNQPLRLTPHDAHLLSLYGGAWIGGTIGGCLFTIKWYYHSVARGKWHLDRRAWRFMTPLVSGALAFATASLFISRVLPIFDARITSSVGAILGLSFVVGYFSDNTVAALAATADRVLGTKTSLKRASDPEE
jgi:hypothetical protein